MTDPSTINPGNPEQPGTQPPSSEAKEESSLRRHYAVVRGLAANSISATVEYPGCVVIELDPETTVWTGLESFAYGTVYRLRDGVMHDTDETAEPGGVLSSRETSETITDAWTRWVRTYQASAGAPESGQ